MKKGTLLIAFALILACSSIACAGTWSKAFHAGEGGSHVSEIKKWKLQVNRLETNMESYSIKIRWDQIMPSMTNWSINGDHNNLIGKSPSKITITDTHRVTTSEKSLDIDVKNRMASISAVANRKSDLYSIEGYFEYVEGLRLPYLIVWARNAEKARLLIFDPLP